MAIYGSLGEVNVGALSASIADTAIDVFVYDTRKDSDGGAWRKRTQHTSWYNETLNTATRGSRRDFPAVAVIVLTSSTLTIYDGDDPDMPMWMVFQFNGNTAIRSLTTATATFAYNGKIAACGQESGGLSYNSGINIVSFIDEKAVWKTNAHSGIFGLPLSSRNTNGGYGNPAGTSDDGGPKIVSRDCNDVTMTVLPNAPIDSVTGLPVPTIAVATSGGTSILRDDGTVASITYTNFNVANLVHFTKDNKIAILTDGATGGARFYRIYDIPTSNLDGGAYNNMGSALRAYNGDGVSYNYPIRYMWFSNTIDTGNFYAQSLVYAKDGPVFGRNGRGIALISEGHTNLPGETIPTLSTSAGMICGISSSVNTGWMHGDIKGAWLSDTSTASVTGTELVTNGTFDSSTTGWTGTTANIVVDTQRLKVTASSNGINGYAVQSISTIAGKKYVAKVDITLGVQTNNFFIGSSSTATDIYEAGWAAATRSIRFEFTALSSTTHLTLATHPATTSYAFFDNISVKRIEEDRSVNNKGLEIVGTITKSAVATGSNLVSYGGWGSSNFLLQPTATPPGTGNFSLCFWIKPGSLNSGSGSYFHLFSLGTSTTTGQASATGFVFKMSTTTAASSFGYIPYFYNGTGTDFNLYDANNYFSIGTWSHCVAGRNGNVFYIYINGKLVKTGSTSTINFTDTYLSIGSPVNTYSEYGGDAQVSLLRYSTTFPSPEQIRKIYNDEKMLFQPNSQCTLYGSSDAVTALAYDDTTKLLSVGTSSGRSDFQGLERINNTTTAVTTAISASNGLIAEQ